MLAPWQGSWAKDFDVLNLPAVRSEIATESLVYSIRKFHGRIYATGIQGHILWSEDDGETWTQAQVPVRSSILDIHFPTPDKGWAVGHEGLILHSVDAGKTWEKQYDGLRYGTEGLAYYQKLALQYPRDPYYSYLVEEMQFAIEQGADKPLFKVYFHSDTHGHAFGAYGMLLRTRDGGQNWEHVLHATENDSFYHLFDFAPLPEPGRFFIAGEAGLLMIGDSNRRKAVRVENVPWEGSFFTSVAAADGRIVLGGLRGRLFSTADEGKSWSEAQKPASSSLVDSVRLADGRLVFAGMAGDLLVSSDHGTSFSRLPISSGTRVYTLAEGPSGTLLVGGPDGIHKLTLPQ
jgi:photosystem II stability/assembly factor-like uncharacterized protein